MKGRTRARQEFTKDIFFVLIGVGVTLFLTWSGTLDVILSYFGNTVIASFFSGIFFTSVFTLAPASVAFARLAGTAPIEMIALWGALGAMIGDLILFFFIRDRFADDLIHSLKPSFAKHLANSFHLGFLKWLSPILGALIIASPLPDELGLTLLGLSRTRLIVLMPVSFLMNMLGIYSVVWFAHLI